MNRLQFILVDDKSPRAAAIAAGLKRQRGVSVALRISDIPSSHGGRYVALVADEPGAVHRATEMLRRAGVPAKVIVYAEDPTPHGMVKAIAAGAADYLHWPCDPADLVAAAAAATASPVG